MKSHLPIRPELREWILSTTHAGHSVEAVLKLMQETGYDPRQSRSIVATVLNMPITALDAHVQAPKLQGRRTRHPEAPQMTIDRKSVV